MCKKIKVETVLNFLEYKKISYKVYGSQNFEIDSFCPLNRVSPKSILWIKNWTEDIEAKLEECANLIVVCKEDAMANNEANCYIFCEDPKMVFFEIIDEFFVDKNTVGHISNSAVVETEKIGFNCSVGEFSVIGPEVEIGDNVVIEHHVTIKGKVKIGNDSIIHSGCVIGKPGFGFYTALDGYKKRVPHLGGILIGNNVEIGANTCIDWGTLGDTEIGNYVKIDNLCHIAHNVSIGDDAMIIAMSLLGGSSCIEKGAYIAPGALIMNQKTVGQDGFVGMGAVVVKDVPARKVVAGVPAKVIRDNV